MSTPNTSSDTTQLVDAFITASRALVGMALRSLAASPTEVTLSQHRALVLLAADGPCPVGRLADTMGVNASNASRLCDRLERLGLVSRQRSVSDGRSVDVSLTAAGREVLRTVHAWRRGEVARVLAGMPDGEPAVLVRVLDSFSAGAHESAASDWVVGLW